MSRVFLSVVLLVCLCATVAVEARGDGSSDRLADARLILERQPQAELAAWQILTAAGLPLVEPHPHDAGLARVTFAYRGHDGVSGVRLDSVVNAPRAAEFVDDYREDFTLPLDRFNGTDIWTLTLDVRRDVQATYSFLVEDGSGVYRRSDPDNPRRLQGMDAESVLMMDGVSGRDAWRPVLPRDQREIRSLALDSEALDRTVLLQVSPAADPQAPLLILYDAFLWGVRVPARDLLDNLTRSGRLPEMHLVLIDQLDPESADHAYADQTDFVVDELLPFLGQSARIRPATENIVVAGASRRGLAAAVIVLSRSDRIGAALSLSGSFYWAPDGEAPEWLRRSVPAAHKGGPRFYLAAGVLEFVHTSTNNGHVMLDANRNMAAALERRGHEVEFSVFGGGHDVAGWRGALADGLVALFGTVDETASQTAD